MIDQYHMFPEGGTVLCAVSGGVDSMSLLCFLRGQASRCGFTLRAAHFDHALRPASDRDAAFVREQCARWEIPCDVTRRDVADWARTQHLGTEEAGRRMRYAWLEELAAQIPDCVIATAHNADDNGETLLLHLVRGSGLNGLGGIAPRRGNVVRPFLWVPRSLILEYAREKDIPHVEDETNGDPDYTPRNRIRAQVIPVLRELNPNLTDTLTDTAVSLSQDGALLDQMAGKLPPTREEDGRVTLSLSALADAPEALALRRIQSAAELVSPGLVLSARQRRMVRNLCRGTEPGGRVSLPRNVLARRVYDKLEFTKDSPSPDLPTRVLDFLGVGEIGPWTVEIEQMPCPAGWRSGKQEFCLPAGSPVTLRPREAGDRLRLPWRRGTKTLKKWFIEEKIPAHLREQVPVLEQNGRVAAVVGLGTDLEALPREGEDCLHITMQRKGE